MKSSLHLCLSVFICGSVFSSASAAQPAITHLYPTGAQRGTSVDVAVAGTIDGGTKVWASGKGVAVEATKGKFKISVAKDAIPGTYWLRAYNSEGASVLRPFIVGTLPEVMEKEPNDEAKKAQLFEGPVVVNGKLAKNGDVDCSAVKLKKGQTLVAALEAHGTLRSPMDGMLQILSADGFVLEENNDFRGLDPQIAFTAPRDGTYVARVYAFPASPDSSIRYFGSDACVYRLTLTTGAFADFAMPLAVGPQGKPEVEVRGWNLTPESHRLTFATGDDGFATVYGVNLANLLRLRVEPHPVIAKAAGALKPPFSATGLIEKPGGESRFSIDATKGVALSLQVESRSLGLAVNPVVRLLGRDGKQLAKAEPGKLNGDTALSFIPMADGPVTVEVRDLYAGGGPRHVFLLRVQTPEPDYVLSVAADRFTVIPGKPTTIPVKVDRKNGFNKEVEIVAEGLPQGVKLEVLKPKKPDPSTVAISLSADESASGSFRLVGTVRDEPKLRRTAHFQLTEFDATASDLWLTVLKR
ncbi:MAG TPA: PPC domain-containing protein [Gemmata sp.]|nr:PPC domain-containing protein [Gemmata sp.]